MPTADGRGTGEPKPGRPAGPGAHAAGRAVPADPATQQRAIAALFIALLSLAGLLSLNYLQRGIFLVSYALLAGLVAMWLAATSLAKARRARTARPRGSVLATVIAAAGIVLSLVMLAAFIVLGPQLTAYGQCLSAAGGSSDQQACENQFIHAVNREVANLGAHR